MDTAADGLLDLVNSFAREPTRANIQGLQRVKNRLLEALRSPAAPSAAGLGTAESAQLCELTGVDAATAAQLLAAASSQVRLFSCTH
jgi:hypothetical protein